jgi:phosphoesterase RecJ-like protein
MQETLIQIRELLMNHQRFAVIAHVRPDGDAYGTALALAWTLQAMGKEASVYNQDGLLSTYTFLPGADRLQVTPVGGTDEEVKWVAVDTSTYERLGENLTRTKRVPDLNLDHHGSNTRYGVINWVVGESPASAQVLFELMEALALPLTPEAATNLYVGLMTDTGSFRYRGTTERTLTVAAKLVAAGADPASLADLCYRRISLARFLLMREVLNFTEFRAGNRVAFYRLTQEMFVRTGAQADEVENFLDILQTIDTVEVSFMVQEIEAGFTRVSLRSRARVDVSQLAAKFGGGGHKLAAGIRSALPMGELEAAIIREIVAVLPEELTEK